MSVDYSRGRGTVDGIPEPQVSGAESQKEAQHLGDLYQTIKDERKDKKEQKVSDMRELNRQIAPGGKSQRIKNASPFYKNQQAKRFGIDGATRNTSAKERRAERQEEQQQRTTSAVLAGQH